MNIAPKRLNHKAAAPPAATMTRIESFGGAGKRPSIWDEEPNPKKLGASCGTSNNAVEFGDPSHITTNDDDDDSIEELKGIALEHLVPLDVDELERRVGVAIVPPSHFESLGHDDYYSQSLLQNFQADLLQETMYLTKQQQGQKEKVRIDIGREGLTSRGSYYILHDAALLPLWRAFRDALLGCPIAHEYELNVQNVHLSSKVLDMLSMAIRGKQVTSVKFNNVWLRKPGFNFASRLVKNSIRIMSTVELKGCHAGGDIESLTAIVDAVRNNVNNLSLSNNGINAEGAKVIADVLKDNPKLLEGIWLEDNDMKDDGIQHLMRALGSNTNLKSMHIERNGITPVGLSSLEKAAFDTTSMATIIDSNHTCRLHYAGLRQFRPEYLTCWGKLSPSRYSENVMRQKIYTAFGCCLDNPIECRYLEDVPMKLMPTVLEFAQVVPYYCEVLHAWMDSSGESERGERISLKNVYDVVRRWVVPLVFCPKEDVKGLKRSRSRISD